MAVIPVDGHQVVLSQHAVSRWRERLRPALEQVAALEQLASAVATEGAIRRRRPNGVNPASRVRMMLETVGWLVVDGAAFPLAESDGELVAKTCIPTRRSE